MRFLQRVGIASLLVTQLSLIGLAQSGFIKTVAGNGAAGLRGDGGPAISAELLRPSGVAIDTLGNLYIVDPVAGRIRKVTPAGIISTVAGGGSSLEEGVPALSARLSIPQGIAIDAAGNIYIADTGSHRIRKVSPSGLITTVAGNGTEGFSGDDGPATSAQLYYPSSIVIDAAVNLLIGDQRNGRVRKVTPAGVITTYAGSEKPGTGGDYGPATSAQLSISGSLAIDAQGNLYIPSISSVRKVTPAGLITTIAGNIFDQGFGGDDGPAISAQLRYVSAVATDPGGNLYVADIWDHRIRKVTPAGIISTLAGDGTARYGGDKGPAISAQVCRPSGMVADAAGNLYIADQGNNRIRRIEAADVVPTFFPQVVVGGGYSTLFTVTNAGASAVSGKLILSDQQGNVLNVGGTLMDAFGTIQPVFGSSIAFAVPAGGTIFCLATGLSPSSPTMVGWAQLQSIGGGLNAVATYEYVVGGRIQNMVGVPQSPPLQVAIIPVDIDDSEGKQMVYGIVNPSDQGIFVNLALVSQDGTVINDTVVVALLPGQQIARYLWQDLTLRKFKGSLVLHSQNGRTFFAIGLQEKQGIYTVIPLIPGKAPFVSN